ncbi:MAG: hypothetical protein ACJ761_11125 [Chloroflexota bacterium]
MPDRNYSARILAAVGVAAGVAGAALTTAIGAATRRASEPPAKTRKSRDRSGKSSRGKRRPA